MAGQCTYMQMHLVILCLAYLHCLYAFVILCLNTWLSDFLYAAVFLYAFNVLSVCLVFARVC